VKTSFDKHKKRAHGPFFRHQIFSWKNLVP
jgi:hypothetical protein